MHILYKQFTLLRTYAHVCVRVCVCSTCSLRMGFVALINLCSQSPGLARRDILTCLARCVFLEEAPFQHCKRHHIVLITSLWTSPGFIIRFAGNDIKWFRLGHPPETRFISGNSRFCKVQLAK